MLKEYRPIQNLNLKRAKMYATLRYIDLEQLTRGDLICIIRELSKGLSTLETRLTIKRKSKIK